MYEFCNDMSARNRRWEIRQAPGGAAGEVRLGDGTVVPPELVEIAARRGVADAASYFEPTLRAAMPDPSSLPRMDEASSRFARAVRDGEKVAIFGDYDVDGATSVALLTRFLRQAGIRDSMFHIPQRLTEGYGPNIPAITGLRERGAGLLVIADSGTTAFEAISHAVSIGFDVIVLDHHEPKDDGALPSAIVVNPKCGEDVSGLTYLCSAGLVMLFLVAVNRQLRQEGFFAARGIGEPRLLDMMGLVALGTVADMVPLEGLNRAYVKNGLRALPQIVGIQALMDAADNQECSARSCGFVLGPCINAGGRISDTMQGARLLISDDVGEAKEIAGHLFDLNRERQQMQKDMVADCLNRVSGEGSGDLVIVVYDQEWHPGVVGLGASKVKDFFDRSAVVIGRDGKGSGRSVEGFNIGKAFIKAQEAGLLKKGGGHAAAGGLTVAPDRIAGFRAFINGEAKDFRRPPTKVDMAVPVGLLPRHVVEAFDLMAPFGMGNPRPRIALTGGVLADVRVLKGAHVKARLLGAGGEADLILFNGVGTALGGALQGAEGRFADVLGEIGLNSYGGVTKIQIKPEDAMIGAPASALAEAAH